MMMMMMMMMMMTATAATSTTTGTLPTLEIRTPETNPNYAPKSGFTGPGAERAKYKPGFRNLKFGVYDARV